MIVTSSVDDEGTKAMLKALHSVYTPNKCIMVLTQNNNPTDTANQFLAQHHPYFKGMKMVQDKATVYICKNFACQMPINNTEALVKALSQPSSP